LKLLNRKETADILKCSVSKVIQLEEKGYLIPVKLPQTTEAKSDRTLILYDSDDIQRLIDSSKDFSKANKDIFIKDEPEKEQDDSE